MRDEFEDEEENDSSSDELKPMEQGSKQDRKK
jgi:hypothetical protein